MLDQVLLHPSLASALPHPSPSRLTTICEAVMRWLPPSLADPPHPRPSLVTLPTLMSTCGAEAADLGAAVEHSGGTVHPLRGPVVEAVRRGSLAVFKGAVGGAGAGSSSVALAGQQLGNDLGATPRELPATPHLPAVSPSLPLSFSLFLSLSLTHSIHPSIHSSIPPSIHPSLAHSLPPSLPP